jgi:hypothetical protein
VSNRVRRTPRKIAGLSGDCEGSSMTGFKVSPVYSVGSLYREVSSGNTSLLLAESSLRLRDVSKSPVAVASDLPGVSNRQSLGATRSRIS